MIQEVIDVRVGACQKVIIFGTAFGWPGDFKCEARLEILIVAKEAERRFVNHNSTIEKSLVTELPIRERDRDLALSAG